ncbi:adenylyl-sulfate kinase [Nocardioides mesophilus]|uniref:adenylyl-sulfate kinase n=1 Tax=Nocardioides mesophilus TaxID=433659 RepID=A0A7G9REC4_9ACTN|nr:adenylyl-sulfate kinase [Nocardioides mesophilus]QNN53949.1 adenylyl-sulfate kinase [Nocardioides mesophilus]
MSETPLPQHCPSPRELDDLELLTNGALAPLTGFEGPDGLVTLRVPAEVAAAAETAGGLELVDPEGVPLATVAVTTTYDVAGSGLRGIEGPVTPLAHNEFGAFRSVHLSPGQVRQRYGADVLTVPVAGALTGPDLERIREAAGDKPVLLLALTGHGTPDLSAPALVRATLAAAALLPDAHVAAVPLASRGPDQASADHELGQRVVAAYAPGAVLGVTGQGEPPAEVAAIVERDRPGPAEQGLVLFFTGLSGSGKSTLARALHDAILERGERTVTSLDGDVVRRNLSAGLTFSKEDRETNIRRIGWVAAEISRHGGVAICSPIAPFDSTRQQVRVMTEEAGGAFVLIHVATPLEECERRDRKGLYAKARAGIIPEFTGISSPYEEPEDAAVRVDTTGRSIEDALGDVLAWLDEAGYLMKDV